MSTNYRKLMALLVVVVCLPTISFGFLGDSQTKNQTPYSPDRIIVKFKPAAKVNFSPAKSGAPETGIKAVDDVSRRFGVTAAKGLLPESIRSRHKEFSDVHVLTVPDKSNIEDIVRAYRALPQVEYAEPDYALELLGTPNDPLYQHQWYLNNTGQQHYYADTVTSSLILVAGTPDADIDAEEVYQNPPTQTTTSVVAILDTGVDTDHPDIVDNLWVNEGEIPGNGKDDDYNGYVDDYSGWNFDPLDFGNYSTQNIEDYHGHGTFVAGVVGSVIDNYEGVAGISPDVKIMVLKADPLFVSLAAEAIVYAADNGADVMNMSWRVFDGQYSITLKEACQYAYDKQVTLVAAIGNDGCERYNEPAIYSTTIAVGATTDQDEVVWFSTFNDSINVCAPGNQIVSLRSNATDFYKNGYHIINDLYYIANGTSFASPCVAGIASVLHSISPGLTPAKTKEIIENTADDFTEYYDHSTQTLITGLTGWDKYSGYGRANLYQAVQAAPETRAKITYPLPFRQYGGIIDIQGTADWSGTNTYTVEYGAGDNPQSWQLIASGSSPVVNDVLASFDTQGLSGTYSIRLTVGTDNISIVTVHLVNSCVAEIISPQSLETVGSLVSIDGWAYCDLGVDSIVLEYGNGDYPPVFGPGYGANINKWTTPLFNDSTAYWFVNDFEPGEYNLRLGLYYNDALEIADTVRITIHPDFSGADAYQVQLPDVTTPTANYCDFDHDGNKEIIMGTLSGIVALNSDGSIKTDGMPDFPEGDFRAPIAVGDINGDGYDDIVAFRRDQLLLYVFLSSGIDLTIPVDITLDDPLTPPYFTEGLKDRIILSDLDADKKDEIILYFSSEKEAFIIDDNGAQLAHLQSVAEVQPADLDGDGLYEIYAAYETFDIELNGYYLTQLEQFSITGEFVANTNFTNAEGAKYNFDNIDVCDINNDGTQDLIITGHYIGSPDNKYSFYAFGPGFQVLSTWPHETQIPSFMDAYGLVFADLDLDGTMEYILSAYDASNASIYVWHNNGAPFLSGTDGLFAISPNFGTASPVCVADITGNGQCEIIAGLASDLTPLFRFKRIVAWNTNGSVVQGFPKYFGCRNSSIPSRWLSTPMVGDLDNDGNIDIAITDPDSSFAFVNFPNVPLNTDLLQVEAWRANRKHNGIPEDRYVATIATPENNEVIGGQINVTGTADGITFPGYTLEYGSGNDPQTWYTIAASSTPINNGVLGAWDVGNLSGWQTLRLTLGTYHAVLRSVYVANEPVAEITSPSENETIPGMQSVVAVSGTAADTNHSGYTLEYGEGASPTSWNTIVASDETVIDGQLATWDITPLNGLYTLRLSIGSNPLFYQQVNIANDPIAEITSPLENDIFWGIETTVPISGTATCPSFDHADIEYGEGQTPTDWYLIGSITSRVYDDNILDWDWITDDFAEGQFTIRMSVYSAFGLEATDEVTVERKQNYFGDGHGWVASLNGDGGATANYGDFDGDGTTEIVVGTSEGVYYFDLNGNPKTMEPLPPGDYRIPAAVGNLDGDSADDFVIIGVNGSQATLYCVPSQGGYTSVPLETAPEMSHFEPVPNNPAYIPELYLKDINGDGLDEIHYFTGNTDAGSHYGEYYIYNPDGTPFSGLPSFGAPCLQAFPADLNRDGVCEIYVSGLAAGDYTLKQYDLSGNVLHTFNLKPGSSFIVPMSYSSADIDSDGKAELLCLADVSSTGKLYAFNENLEVEDGWPITLPYAYYQNPVLADLNGDDIPEIITADYDNIYAWNLDGTSFIPGADGLFATSPNPGVLSIPVITDADGDETPDLISLANRRKNIPYYAERLLAYDNGAELLPDYPIFTATDTRNYERYLHVPIVGDLDEDGNLDILAISATQKLMFNNFSGVPYDPSLTPVPMWRYNRRLNNTRRIEHATLRVPEVFSTIQAAIDVAINGDTVLVAPGTYSGSLISFHGKAITVKSENGPQTTTISGGPNATIFSFADGETESSVLEGFKLSGGGIAVRCANAAPTIRHNIMVNQVSSLPGTGAICLWGSTFDSDGDSPARIINNTIVGGNHSGIADRSSIPPDIRNNIIYDNDIYGIDFCTTLHKPWEHPVLDYNDVYANGTNYHNVTNPGDSSISADPMFTLNYLISTLSPCYNAGDPDPQYNDPDGSRNDMGAVPYQEFTPIPGPGHLKNSQIPAEFAISQNYPNPFNPTTSIRLSIPEASHVTVMIYNILGQRVATLVDGDMQPGYHDVVWSGKDDRGTAVASGVYLYRVVSNKFVATKKMVLLK